MMLIRRLTILIKHQVKHVANLRLLSTETAIVSSPYPDVTIPKIPLHRYIFENFHKWPNHTAVECAVSGKKFTFSELQAKSKRLATSFRKLGLKKGDIIFLDLPNTPEFAVASLGALEAGLTACTINPAYAHEEVISQLKDCRGDWVICHPSTLRVVQEAKLVVKNIKIICTDDIDSSFPTTDGDIIRFEELIDDSVNLFDKSENMDVSETALIAYSSGTTGLPKGTCLTHQSIVANLTQNLSPHVTKLIETHGEHQDVIPTILPLFHCYGNIVLLLQGLRFGAKIITLPKFDPKVFLSTLENHENVLLFLVPPIIFFLGNSNDVTKKHLKGVRHIMNGAAPCSAYDLAKIKQKNSNIILSQGYGLTEASPVLTSFHPSGPDHENMSTVGHLLPNTFAKTISFDNGEVLKHDEVGELLFKGPQIMAGYLNNPKATAATIDEDGWLHTGDVGYYDKEGYFYITDRVKEMIKVKGFQVAPAEIEEVLRRHPGVLEAGVVGAPCERSGEVPVAFVQTAPGFTTTEQDIKDFVASHLSKTKHLSSVKFLPSIPKTAAGKILRKVLKTMI